MLHPLNSVSAEGYTNLGFFVGSLSVALLRIGLEHSKEMASFVVSKTKGIPPTKEYFNISHILRTGEVGWEMLNL